HRGDEALFWDFDNLQCLCGACHSGAKQREEQATAWE
ncbi:HNH endonuclease, partial [Halomonas sp. ND22Bw]